MTEPAVIALCVASSAITSLWHHLAGSSAEIRAVRATCSHSWGPNTEVCPPGMWGSRQRYYMRFCERGCGEQLHTNADGTPYVPRRMRDDK
jgi:hypothetical protein